MSTEPTVRLSPPLAASEAESRVLLATASDPDARRIADELERSEEGARLTLVHVTTVAEARRRCLEGFGLILVDLGLAGADSPEGVAALHALAPNSAIVALARFEKEPAITLALRAGASEFLIKGLYSATALLAILRHARVANRNLSPPESLARYQSLSRDADTTLPNAELFGDLGRYAAGVAFRSGGQLALCDIMLDGSQTTDASVPPAIAAILREATRETDALARLGPLSYAVLFGPAISPGEVDRVMKRIIERLMKLPAAADSAETLRVAVGVAQFPKHSDTYEQLRVNAGLAALAAQRQGAGSLVFYELGLRGGIE